MYNIVIEELSDSYDCDDCGPSWATGFNVTIDGEPYGDYEPVAHCYSSYHYNIEEVLKDLLESFGHTVTIK